MESKGGPKHEPRGYPKLASVMGPYPEMGLYRKFAELNARNLLYLQAEILHLEEDLKVYTMEDYEPPPGEEERQEYATSFKALMDGGKSGISQQWPTILKLRKKLQEYNAVLLQQAEISKLHRPRKYDWDRLYEWLFVKDGGNRFLDAPEGYPWRKRYFGDLVAISGREDSDIVTRLISEKLIPMIPNSILYRFKDPEKGHEAFGLVHFPDEKFKSCARVFSVILSTVFPSIAILALWYIHSIPHRLIAVLGFSVLFSVLLALFTTARPVEIFTASLA